MVEAALGRSSSGLITGWSPPGDYDGVGVASLVPDQPNVWTDGSLVLDQVTGVSSSGAGFYAHQSEDCWSGRRWGHFDRVQSDDGVPTCRGFISVSVNRISPDTAIHEQMATQSYFTTSTTS